MSDFIRLNIARENDGSGQLFLEFGADGFSGSGAAYFDLALLADRAREFAAYPLPIDAPVLLAGGFLDKGDFSRLRQEHLHVSAYPLGGSGRIGLMLKVAEPADDGRQDVLRRSASAEFLVNYDLLSRFSKGLVELATGKCEDFMLEMPG